MGFNSGFKGLIQTGTFLPTALENQFLSVKLSTVLLFGSEMKYMRRTAGYIWTDYKTSAQIAKELKITPILDKLLEYKRNWMQHVNRMPRNRLPRVMKHYFPTGRRNHGRPLKRLLDTWDRNGSTSGPTPWQIYDDDDDTIWTSCGVWLLVPSWALVPEFCFLLLQTGDEMIA